MKKKTKSANAIIISKDDYEHFKTKAIEVLTTEYMKKKTTPANAIIISAEVIEALTTEYILKQWVAGYHEDACGIRHKDGRAQTKTRSSNANT